MSKSILSNDKKCYICGTPYNLHRHHCLYGTANRKQAEKYGLWVYLCGFHHNLSDYGVHFDRELDLRLKRECQQKWEEINGDREQFIRTFGKSYL